MILVGFSSSESHSRNCPRRPRRVDISDKSSTPPGARPANDVSFVKAPRLTSDRAHGSTLAAGPSTSHLSEADALRGVARVGVVVVDERGHVLDEGRAGSQRHRNLAHCLKKDHYLNYSFKAF